MLALANVKIVLLICARQSQVVAYFVVVFQLHMMPHDHRKPTGHPGYRTAAEDVGSPRDHHLFLKGRPIWYPLPLVT